MFHRTRDAMEAQLTIVLTARTVSRTFQNRTELALRNVIRQLRPYVQRLSPSTAPLTFDPDIGTEQQAILHAIRSPITREQRVDKNLRDLI